eukprot:COSAG01_NODE_493_length_16327_cov_5.632879_10_plen_211_part_00
MQYISGGSSQRVTLRDLQDAVDRAADRGAGYDSYREDEPYGRRGGYADEYWDVRRSDSAAMRPGFRPDLAPTSVINTLTNYVPRIRDLLHAVDTRRTGTVTLHDFRRVLRRLGLRLDENDVDTFMLALDTTGRDSLFAYEPMLKWLSGRSRRLTNPALVGVLKRLAGPRVYPRLHQVLQSKIYRAGNYGGSDEIAVEELRDVCTRLDVPL